MRELFVYTPEYFRKERNIEVRTGARVASLSHARREVALATGERVRYGRLVIATGARCDAAAIAGSAPAARFHRCIPRRTLNGCGASWASGGRSGPW